MTGIHTIIVFIIYYIGSLEAKRRQNYPGGSNALSEDEINSMYPHRELKQPPKIANEPLPPYNEDDRYFFFAGDDGIVHQVDKESPIDTAIIKRYSRDQHNNRYLLFTRKNRHIPQEIYFGDAQSIIDTNFDSAKITVFTIHGWNGHASAAINIMLTKGFLDNDDVNVIVFDWGKLALNHNYVLAKSGVPDVGRMLGRFINWLVGNGFAVFHKIHLVGHSLGGHVAGNAGRETGSAVARITAMDPAGPLWYNDPDRLVATDSVYVEVLHTNIKANGISLECGDADFYVNGGVSQPGCFSLNVCSHLRAYELMASSLESNHFKGKQCDDFKVEALDACNGTSNYMGNADLYKEGRGIYRVDTLAVYPF